MYEVIATESYIWIVSELCCGGELFDYLVEKGRLSEEETKILFGQLCLAVAYLHSLGIVHRDLKLENVLLDERCRVKLGDFGFTREYERGSLMETFCGTTGYASPEMLQGKKYQGPEVDVWSLGVILYCLLTGTLPFDDDDEDIMKQKVVKGEFEDPGWLSLESRDLIKSVLEKDPMKRLTIPQIFAHPWFTAKELSYEPESPLSLQTQSLQPTRPTTPERRLSVSVPMTPNESPKADPFDSIVNTAGQDTPNSLVDGQDRKPLKIRPVSWSNSSGSKIPPSKIRTPARTKRRSVSSIMSLSEGNLQNGDAEPPTPLPAPAPRDLDFASLLSKPTPIIFSTPMERQLLNSLSALGMDTAQTVHSVLSDACDCAGAIWWMLKKKAERKLLEEGGSFDFPPSPATADIPSRLIDDEIPKSAGTIKGKGRVQTGVQTDTTSPAEAVVAIQPPLFSFVPPTPTFVRPSTPPRNGSPTRSPMLSPSTSTLNGEFPSRSHPSTPGSSMNGSKGRKNRAGSVSIMQRATTALEAAGLVRKKSAEAVRELREQERRATTSGEDSRSSEQSHENYKSANGGSSKLHKSPPLKPQRDPPGPTTPPRSEGHESGHIGSPWVLADARQNLSHQAVSHPPGAVSAIRGEMIHSYSAPNLDTKATIKAPAPHRNRANILTSLKMWFNDDRKGKRKEVDKANRMPVTPQPTYARVVPSGTAKRRGSNASAKHARNSTGHRAKRPSMSSRRSSSVNSRRSSITSMQVPILDSPQQLRQAGSRTPNSELGGEHEHSSRPSSIHSAGRHPRHRKSPSASSSGSFRLRTASPMQKYHRRAGSGSSTTRVVRQPLARPPHVRNNSATSSLYSPPSSRPTSFYEPSDNDLQPRNGSPYRARRHSEESTPRRPVVASTTASTFVASKRQGPFASPAVGGTHGKSSWKKSWGLEPPGWQSRTAQLPVEVLVISPSALNEPATLRDVFSGRHSFSQAADDSDWVDEDEDIPAFAGGLGQLGASISGSSGGSNGGMMMNPEPVVTLSPAPRGHRNTSKRNNKPSTSSTGPMMGGVSRSSKPGHSPAERMSPLPSVSENPLPEPRGGRRQLPSGRPGPAFKHAIQEEDEDEEEE
ncbi:CAMK/CAMKL/MARK protein kinase [Coprinopsis sp. MPI-PUGE-AT-0042]|nr:CAMK/CAMKL/MARK protein kinase [Coprinopsis sp. MPI-PUGE-AT-0042]